MRSTKLLVAPVLALLLVACQSMDEDTSIRVDVVPTGVGPAANVPPDPQFRAARVQVPPPVLDVAALHQRWTAQWLPPGPCSWRTYRVGNPPKSPLTSGSIAMPSIGRALEAARVDGSVCGPVIVIGAGLWSETPLAITKPTIIVGGSNVVVSATIASTAGQPLWMQDVVIDDAPFPGAIFASHWSNETTLVRVNVRDAQGIGVIQNGGVLSMFESSVRGGFAPRDPFADPRVDPVAVRNGFGQPLANLRPTRKAPAPDHLSAVVKRATADVGGSLGPYITDKRRVRPFKPYDMIDLTNGTCVGSGAVLKGGLAELGTVTYGGNEGAGLAVSDTLAVALNVGAVFNGLTPHDDTNPAPLIDGPGCYGGVHAKKGAGLVFEGGGAIGNQPVGLAATQDTVTVWGTFTGMSNQAWMPGGWGDGVTATHGSFLSFEGIEAKGNGRAGVLLVGAKANLFSGVSTQNRFGLVMVEASTAYLGTFDYAGNSTQDFLTDGPFSVPSEPEEVP